MVSSLNSESRSMHPIRAVSQVRTYTASPLPQRVAFQSQSSTGLTDHTISDKEWLNSSSQVRGFFIVVSPQFLPHNGPRAASRRKPCLIWTTLRHPQLGLDVNFNRCRHGYRRRTCIPLQLRAVERRRAPQRSPAAYHFHESPFLNPHPGRASTPRRPIHGASTKLRHLSSRFSRGADRFSLRG